MRSSFPERFFPHFAVFALKISSHIGGLGCSLLYEAPTRFAEPVATRLRRVDRAHEVQVLRHGPPSIPQASGARMPAASSRRGCLSERQRLPKAGELPRGWPA